MSRAPLERVKCLLVDDRDENLLVLSALLRTDDVELLQAGSGAEALELLLVHDVALALLDVHMPEMDGFELAELMRGTERTRDVPLIFVTAGMRDSHRTFKGYETGAVDFLYKPIEPQVLRNKAAVFFQLHRQKLQLARELHERTETLRLNEMFTAVLGHDLRNPLSAMLNSAQLLALQSDDERVKQTAGRMVVSGKRMSRMIDDLLDLARVRLADGLLLKRESGDLAALLERVVAEHQAAAPARQFEVVREGELMGNWDGDRMAQVASNLIGNAIQHGGPGPIELRADGTDAAIVRFSVTNTGVIRSELLPFLFDPFRGGERQAARSEGLGLGLYIAQQIVQAHQGGVSVDVIGGDRTVFTVTVPRRRIELISL